MSTSNEQRIELIDTHCHLDFPEFDPDREEVIQNAQAAGITRMINIGSSLRGSQRSLELSRAYDSIYAAIGIHPHDADSYDADTAELLRNLAKQDKVVAIGETGLDYFKNYSQAENQVSLFVSLVELAKDTGLPLVIHSRQAQSDTLRILREAMPLEAVVHCFSGDEIFLRECLDLGFSVSFTCNITYKKAVDLKGIVRLTPLERMFLETDAPFLSPEGSRGKRNEPLNVGYLAKEIALIKGIDPQEVAAVTTGNAKKFFRIP